MFNSIIFWGLTFLSLGGCGLALAKGGAGERMAAGVIIAATHAVFSDPAVERLSTCGALEVVVTDTLPVPPEHQFENLTVLSIAPLIARAIQEVFEDGSVTSLFDGRS